VSDGLLALYEEWGKPQKNRGREKRMKIWQTSYLERVMGTGRWERGGSRWAIGSQAKVFWSSLLVPISTPRELIIHTEDLSTQTSPHESFMIWYGLKGRNSFPLERLGMIDTEI